MAEPKIFSACRLTGSMMNPDLFFITIDSRNGLARQVVNIRSMLCSMVMTVFRKAV
jgi:hypothetical protein